jgi:hypothetical protein
VSNWQTNENDIDRAFEAIRNAVTLQRRHDE